MSSCQVSRYQLGRVPRPVTPAPPPDGFDGASGPPDYPTSTTQPRCQIICSSAAAGSGLFLRLYAGIIFDSSECICE